MAPAIIWNKGAGLRLLLLRCVAVVTDGMRNGLQPCISHESVFSCDVLGTSAFFSPPSPSLTRALNWPPPPFSMLPIHNSCHLLS